jgi:hypothetical protein
MSNDNIFSGLKVVDLASFIAGPSAAVILSDFGADVIKVEPPTGDYWRHGHLIPPQPQAKEAYPWHLANRNKRGMALDLKSPSAQQVLEKLVKWADVLIVNTPHPARKKLKLEYDDVAQWNPRLIYASPKCLRSAPRRLENTTRRFSGSLASTRQKSKAWPRAAPYPKQRNARRSSDGENGHDGHPKLYGVPKPARLTAYAIEREDEEHGRAHQIE